MEKYIVFTRTQGGYKYEFVEAKNVEEVLAAVKFTDELFVAPVDYVTRARVETIRKAIPVEIDSAKVVNEAVANPQKLAKAFSLGH